MQNFILMLAPIEGVTNSAFRSLCHQYGADLTMTPMARIDGLVRKNSVTCKRVEIKDETPTIIQLIGTKEEYFKKYLDDFTPPPGFRGFNLNLGCSSPQFVKIGQGAAMMKRVSKVKHIVDLIKDRGHRVSVKMRLGLNEFEKEKKTYLNLIQGVDAGLFIVHARHGAQTYKDPADFSVYAECVATGRDIIANGDISTWTQIEALKAAGVKGVMIGRAAVANPAIFNRLKGKPEPPSTDLIYQYRQLAASFGEPSPASFDVSKGPMESG